ncbi:MAG: ferritin family protein [Sedimentisphaerales bacterium]|nr:ferritin family protein [Sedimentisphaerales bacterium]
MAITFNLDEIFEMAEQIERNAAKFYHEASKKASDKKIIKTFIDLAAMEDGHMKTFQDMRKALSPEEKDTTAFDPENQAVLYLQAMADSHGTEGKKERDVMLTGSESLREVFEIAITAEKNSVVFYTALKELVEQTGRDKVDTIINEELGHLALLKLHLASIG